MVLLGISIIRAYREGVPGKWIEIVGNAFRDVENTSLDGSIWTGITLSFFVFILESQGNG